MPDPATIDRPWIDAYPPGVPPEYPIPVVALTRLFDDAVRDFPTREALRFGGTSTSWLDLADRVDQARATLIASGVGPGDHVGFLAPNLPGTVAALFATWRIGAVAVPVDPRLPDEDASRLLAMADVGVVVGARDEVQRLVAVAGRLPSRPSVVVTDPRAWLDVRGRVRQALPRRGAWLGWRPRDLRATTLPDGVPCIEDEDGRASPGPAVDPASTAAVLFTGGTTGDRRAVRLSHRGLVANAFQARLWIPDARAGHERVLCALPFTHAYGLTTGLLTSTLMAATMVLPHRPEPEHLLALVETEQPTLVPGVPTLYQSLLDHPDVDRRDLRSVRVCVSGAAPLSPSLAAEFEERSGGARVREGYGLTEAGPLTHANPVYGRTTDGAIGLPVTSTVAIVVDPDDPTRVLSPGEVGELAVHGPQVMQGYLDDDESTSRVLRDGWLLTGDLAVQEAGGVFRLVEPGALAGQEGHLRSSRTTLDAVSRRGRRGRDREDEA